jgi:uncharacterized protein DUF6714
VSAQRPSGSGGAGAASEIEAQIDRAFGARAATPALSLRGGAALDVYDPPPPFDPGLDAPTDAYLEQFCAGLFHLDADSWLYYLPLVLRLALARAARPGDALVESTLWTLRPPDRDPPRLGRLGAAQESAVVAVLEHLAFAPESQNQEFALQVLEEYWIPGAQYR